MYASNVEGTRSVIERRRRWVRRTVIAAAWRPWFWRLSAPVRKLNPVTVADMIATTNGQSSWRSRWHSKRDGQGPNVVVVNPTTPVGEGDLKPTPTGRIIVIF